MSRSMSGVRRELILAISKTNIEQLCTSRVFRFSSPFDPYSAICCDHQHHTFTVKNLSACVLTRLVLRTFFFTIKIYYVFFFLPRSTKYIYMFFTSSILL